jgi:DNA-binding transcriptional MerR regulator
MLKIGDFSKLARISIRMLRHYDEIGLLEPKSIDQVTGYRYYGEDQLPMACRITSLKEMGFGLAVIGNIIRNYNNPKELARFLEIKQSEVNLELQETNRRVRLLETAIERLREDETSMNYNVTLKNIPQRYVASVRNVIPAYNQEGILWNILMTETAGHNLQSDENCFSLAIFHGEGHNDNDVDVEIQVSVKGMYQDTEHVKFKTVPGVEIASAIYKGSYEHLTDVNQAVANWVNDNGYEFNGSLFCIYHVSPAQTKNPEEMVTEVCYPIRLRS